MIKATDMPLVAPWRLTLLPCRKGKAYLYSVVMTAAASVGFTSSRGQPATSFRSTLTTLLLPLLMLLACLSSLSQALAMLLSRLSGYFCSSSLVKLHWAATLLAAARGALVVDVATLLLEASSMLVCAVSSLKLQTQQLSCSKCGF
jgi:hypothetical protein